ncbi:hypothetical protein MYCTH_2308162 [Thermothelomyces thermophilus ATCC 42464]|uniref:Uncharacterized protein n=1 Tax=Thermothelomyces thermophilus (strain ATCC 42464 / BCRC 31852 / DSM 1799) TaxID=573729 RepID=G2QJD1_THET4|nr:uncharacterized protein MYCTH_2308162 [Thermothelomyces thermophilus ATCC 42464]AEO59688.1 hypothetical protein MYCTH_2308162 [Thermothelomyces thermophilus ATCC 42464]
MAPIVPVRIQLPADLDVNKCLFPSRTPQACPRCNSTNDTTAAAAAAAAAADDPAHGPPLHRTRPQRGQAAASAALVSTPARPTGAAFPGQLSELAEEGGGATKEELFGRAVAAARLRELVHRDRRWPRLCAVLVLVGACLGGWWVVCGRQLH